MSLPRETISGFRWIRQLGGGAFGKVYLAEDESQPGKLVAIKQIKKDRLSDLQTLKEAAMMRKVENHDNIIRLYDILETAQYLYLVVEYAEHGELFDFVVSGMQERFAWHYFRQMASAVEHMHQHGICHRDLKLENILVDGQYNAKVCDFGFSRFLRAAGSSEDSIMLTMCGSPAYVAPEVLSGQGYYGDRADRWSLGVILCAIVTACLPVEDRATPGDGFFDKICRREFDYEPWGTTLVGPCAELCKHLLDPNPETRYTWEQIHADPWFVGQTLGGQLLNPMDLTVYMKTQKGELIQGPDMMAGGYAGGFGVVAPEPVYRDGLDLSRPALVEECVYRGVEDEFNFLPLLDEATMKPTIIHIPDGLKVDAAVSRIQDALRARQCVVKALTEEAGVTAFKAKAMTRRGKLVFHVKWFHDGKGKLVAELTRTKGDNMLFRDLHRELCGEVCPKVEAAAPAAAAAAAPPAPVASN